MTGISDDIEWHNECNCPIKNIRESYHLFSHSKQVITYVYMYALERASLKFIFLNCLFVSGATTLFDSNIGAAQHTCLQIQLSRNNSL
jgi:hypothetical protein